MTILHIPRFHGIAPRIANRKLDHAQSQIAKNCELFSEELRPVRDSIQVNYPSLEGLKLGIYLLVDTWLAWNDDVDVARSPLYLENENRIHYSGNYNPKSTNYSLAILGPSTEYPTNYYRLGLPRPDTAPTVGTTGGSGNDVERSYVYTFVTDWGEEGPPSPAGTATGPIDATSWDLSAIDNTPPNTGTLQAVTVNASTVDLTLIAASGSHFFETTEYITISGTIVGTGDLPTDLIGTFQCTRTGVDTVSIPLATNGTWSSGGTWGREAEIQTSGSWRRRIYRSLGGEYRYVDEITSGTTYTDSVADDELGENLPGGILEAQWWKAPNGDMQGLTSFPGGSLVGFFGNTLAFSEPNVPNAWPDEYQYTFNFNIVGIGIVGNTVVVTTDGFPSIVTGDHPESMVQSELEVFQSCVAKKGIVSLLNGVVYPSTDGLVYVPAVGSPEILTRQYLKKKDWELYNPTSLIAGQFDDRYYGFYSSAGANNNEIGGIIFDPKEIGATFTQLDFDIDAVHSDLENDSLYLLSGDVISKFDSGGSFLAYQWLSKLYTTPKPVCFKAAQVKHTRSIAISDTEIADSIAAAVGQVDDELVDTVITPPPLYVACTGLNGTDDAWLAPAAASDTQVATWSVWVNFSNADASQFYIFSADDASNHADLYRDTSNQLVLVLDGDDGSPRLTWTSSDTLVAGGGWHHILISVDISGNQLVYVFVDDVAFAGTPSWSGTNARDIWNSGFYIGIGNDGASDPFAGQVSQFWYDQTYNEIFDTFTVRRYFYDNGYLYFESDGSGPTGSSPLHYHPDAGSNFGVNYGTGDDLTDVGTGDNICVSSLTYASELAPLFYAPLETDADLVYGTGSPTIARTTTNTTATVDTEDGVITSYADDEARFMDGMYIGEGQSTNLIADSEDIDTAFSTKSNVAVDSNVAEAPDGTLTADKMYSDTASDVGHNAYWTSGTVTNGSYYTGSIYVKAGEVDHVILILDGSAHPASSSRLMVLFNLNDGTYSVWNGSPSEYRSRYVGNGWWRIWIEEGTTGTSGARFRVALATSGLTPIWNDFSFSASVGDGVYLWGAQYERYGISTYMPTSGTTGTRGEDTLEYSITDNYDENQGCVIIDFSEPYEYNRNGPGGQGQQHIFGPAGTGEDIIFGRFFSGSNQRDLCTSDDGTIQDPAWVMDDVLLDEEGDVKRIFVSWGPNSKDYTLGYRNVTDGGSWTYKRGSYDGSFPTGGVTLYVLDTLGHARIEIGKITVYDEIPSQEWLESNF